MNRSADGAVFSWRDRVAVLVVGLTARLAVVLWAGTRFPPAADGELYATIARRIADGHGYTWLWPDGAVTYAAHYPVGFPALVALVYRFVGDDPRLVGALLALLGALSAVAVGYVVGAVSGQPRAARAAGGLVALHPGLVLYAPAFMTEGLTASLLSFALAAFVAVQSPARGARIRSLLLLLLGVTLGVATLVRPQSVVLAPLFGAAITAPRWTIRVARALVVLAVALATCAPWTARNCHRMGRCALVSYNGGFNLLIGTDDTARGGWAEVKVPPACREVFVEAEKDACFGREAGRTIVDDPIAWARLAPAKLARTFDYAGAGPWYLHASNPDAFSATAKKVSGAIETLFERLLLLGAVVEAMRRVRLRWPRVAIALGLVGVGFSLVEHAAVAVLALVALWGAAAVSAPRARALDAAAIAVVGSTALLHAVFFGAGRYGLVVFPVVTAMAAFLLAPTAAPTSGAGAGRPRAPEPV